MNTNNPSQNGNFHRVPSETLAAEMLNAMDDQALIEVYRLLVRLNQPDAAGLLAEYARRVLEIDLTGGQH
ncbi:MAG: hypothetical protein KJ077_08335 [Anaerolineae bacterium]|nr:hypothetical protein [Anaerolineae bacterium]